MVRFFQFSKFFTYSAVLIFNNNITLFNVENILMLKTFIRSQVLMLKTFIRSQVRDSPSRNFVKFERHAARASEG
jgi:hypothetical protein